MPSNVGGLSLSLCVCVMPSVGSAAAAACRDAAIASVCRGLMCAWSVGVVQCQLARRESPVELSLSVVGVCCCCRLEMPW